MLNATPLPTLDPEIFSAISAEFARQQSHLELIASENFTYIESAVGILQESPPYSKGELHGFCPKIPPPDL